MVKGMRVGLGVVRIIRNVPAAEIFDLLNRQALFRRRWGYRDIGQIERLDLESRLAIMWHQIVDGDHWSAAACWAVFGAKWQGRHLVLNQGHCQVALVLRPERLPESFWRNRSGLEIIIQAVTLGQRTTGLVRRRRILEERFHWHGLAAEAAEALAEWCHHRAVDRIGWKRHLRISPGFPCWPDIGEQRKIFRLLRPARIGLRLRKNLQLEPEYSTTALIFGCKEKS